MAEPPSPKRAKLELTAISANETIRICLVEPDAPHLGNGAAEPEPVISEFWPVMSHQLFGDDEEIKGHVSPSATVFISHKTFGSAVEFRSEREQPGATKVRQILEDNFTEGLASGDSKPSDLNKLGGALTEDSLKRPLLQQKVSGSCPVSVHHFKLSEAPADVKTMHARAQQLLVFFVDGATPLDQSESEWDLLVAIKRVNDTPVLVGFCTVYRLYAYPTSSRHRVSQILVLPPFQKQGIGKLLLEAVYRAADAAEVQDVTYEEPTEEVQAIRERIELQRALRQPWLLELAEKQGADRVAANGSAASQPPVSLSLGSAEVLRAQKELRIPKQQVRRIWEALLIRQAPFKCEPGAIALRGLVARRLFGSFADTKQQAVDKQIFTLDNLGSFCMRRVPLAAGIKGMPVALEEAQEEGESLEDREAALEEAIDHRMSVLLNLA